MGADHMSNTNNFLPDGYTVPANNGSYMKWQPGENTFRILTSPILGTEYWVTLEGGKRKPKRVRMGENVPMNEIETNPKNGEPERPKHFWALVVWNYDTKQIEILEITQKGIQNSLRQLAKHEDWGTPLNYDLVVTRNGEGIETEYSVIPKPPKELAPEIKEKFEQSEINLEALFSGDDPFGKKK